MVRPASRAFRGNLTNGVIMALIIEIKHCKVHGLEVFKVLINGTLMNTYMSLQFAEQKKRAYIQSWNNDRANTVKRRSA
jgi:hypothetical protein